MGASKYILMHKNVPVIGCKFDDGYFDGFYEDFDVKHLPLGTKGFNGRCNKNAFADWFSRRSVPKDRKNVKTVFPLLQNPGTNQLMLNSFGLSLSDQYWFRPMGANIDWHEVNFFENAFSSELSDVFLGKTEVVSFDGTLVGPDSCSCGDDVKAWRIIDGDRWLAKQGGTFHQEPYNELFGSKVSRLVGAKSAEYRVAVDDGDVYSLSRCMTNCNTELISAYDIFKEFQLDPVDPVKSVDEYVSVLEHHGISDVRSDIGKMCLVDYLIRNEDRHWTNFGVMRDADTLEWQGTIPLFDFGNSMCFDDDDVSSKDVFGRFTKRRLFEDLDFAPKVSGEILQDVVDVAEQIYGNADEIRLSRRLQLIDVVKQRADVVFQHVVTKGLVYDDEAEY